MCSSFSYFENFQEILYDKLNVYNFTLTSYKGKSRQMYIDFPNPKLLNLSVPSP